MPQELFPQKKRVLNNMSAFLVHNNYIYYPHKKHLTHYQKHPLALIYLKYLERL